MQCRSWGGEEDAERSRAKVTEGELIITRKDQIANFKLEVEQFQQFRDADTNAVCMANAYKHKLK